MMLVISLICVRRDVQGYCLRLLRCHFIIDVAIQLPLSIGIINEL
jgi:hypothetical protein